MNADRLARRWFVAAVGYFLASVALGVYIGASGHHTLATVHSHATLLGWVSMGLTAALYRCFPATAESRLAVWHYTLYQSAVPVMLIAVAALRLGHEGARPIAGIASVAVLVAVTAFCWLVLSGGRRESAR